MSGALHAGDRQRKDHGGLLASLGSSGSSTASKSTGGASAICPAGMAAGPGGL